MAATATTRNELLCEYKKKRSFGTSKNELFLGVGVEYSLLMESHVQTNKTPTQINNSSNRTNETNSFIRQFQYAWVHVRGHSRNWLLLHAPVLSSWNSFVKLTILPTPVKYVYNGIGLAIYRSHSEFCKTGIVSFLFGPDRKSLSRIRPSKL